MADNYPKIWQNVKLIRTKISGDLVEYATKIIEVEENDTFVIETPLEKMQLVMLLNGSRLNMSYMLENQGMLSFDVEVVEKLKDNNIPLVRIKKVSDIKKIQRRNFFRLVSAIDIIIRKKNDVIVENRKTVDISGGGMKVISSQDFQLGDLVNTSFSLNKKEFNLEAKVVKIDDSSKDRKEISLQIIDILERDRNEIIKFIFDKQREGIKKGTIFNG